MVSFFFKEALVNAPVGESSFTQAAVGSVKGKRFPRREENKCFNSHPILPFMVKDIDGASYLLVFRGGRSMSKYRRGNTRGYSRYRKRY